MKCNEKDSNVFYERKYEFALPVFQLIFLMPVFFGYFANAKNDTDQ